MYFGGPELADTTEEKDLRVTVYSSMKMHLSAQQWPRKQNGCWDYMEIYIYTLWKIWNKTENIIITQSSDPLISKRLYSKIFKNTEIGNKD